MSRFLPMWLLPAWIVLAGLTAWLFVTVGSLGGGGSERVASLTPQAVRFGDPVVARLHVPRGAQVDVSFAPYHVRSFHRHGRTYVYTLECLSAACVRPGSVRELRFPPALIRIGDKTSTVRWPVLRLGSRLTISDLGSPHFKADPAAPPPAFRLDPGLLGWGMTGVAAALVLGTGAWCARRLRPPKPALQLVPEPELSPLEQALFAVQQTLARPVEERRTALDRLALVLADDALTRQTRRLAWSEDPPDPEAMKRLVSTVRGKGRAA